MTTIATKYPFVGKIETRKGGRDENQDNAGFVDSPLGLLLVVCDGMGGGPGGRTASRMAVDTILSIIADLSASTPRGQALQYAIEKANDAIYALAKDTPELMGMGTTVAAVIVNEQSAVIAHVGDSRVYLLRRGTVVFRTQDHSFVGNLVRENKLTEEEARNHPRSNVITRALGIRPTIEAEIDETPFLTGDRFVLCTDGIWGAMPQQDLVQALSRPMGIEELTHLVADEVDALGNAQGGGHDNLTLALLDPTFDSEVQKVITPPTPPSPPQPTPPPPPVTPPLPSDQANDPSTDREPDPPIDIGDSSPAPPEAAPADDRPAATTGEGHATGEGDTSRPAGLTRILGLALIIALLTAAAWYLLKHQPDKKEGKQPQVEKVQSTSTTAREQEAIEAVKKIKNASNQPAVENKVENQVQIILQDLDSLKTLKRGSYKELQNAKRNFIQQVTIPELDLLMTFIPEDKKERIEQIKKMLADKRAIGATDDGETTGESNHFIDEIKQAVINSSF